MEAESVNKLGGKIDSLIDNVGTNINKLGGKIDSLIDKVGTLSGKIDSLVEKIDVSNSNQENLLNEVKASNRNQERLLYILGKKFFPEEEEFQKPLSESDDKKKVDAKNQQSKSKQSDNK